MLKIRFTRVGRKHDPSFRLVVTESQRPPRSGNFLENLGFYDPKKGKYQLKNERINYWLLKGAQLSDTVHNLLVKEKVIKGDKINVSKKSKKQAVAVKEEVPVGTAPKAEVPAETEAETETEPKTEA